MTEPVEEERPARPKESRVIRELQDQDDRDVVTFLRNLAGDNPVQIKISRMKPTMGPNGEGLKGALETTEEFIDEDYLRRKYGGGTYQLRVLTPNEKGSYVYKRSINVDIAGEPRLSKVAIPDDDGDRGDGDGLGVAKLLADTLTPLLASSREEARDARRALAERGQDPVMAGLLQRVVDNNKDSDLHSSRMRELYEGRIDRLIQGNEESLKQMRQSHADELRQLRQSHTDEIKRMEDRQERREEQMRADARRLEERHVQEMKDAARQQQQYIELSKTTGDVNMLAVKSSHEAQITALKAESARLERELAASQARIAVLEAKKDQSLKEKVQEISGLRELVEDLGGGDGEDKQSTLAKIVETISNSDMAIALMNKIGGAGGNQPPVGVPFQSPDGKTWIVDAVGMQPRPLTEKQLAEIQQQRAAAQQRRMRAASASRKARRPDAPAPRAAQAAAAPAAADAQAPSDDMASQGLADEPETKPKAAAGRRPTRVEIQIALDHASSAMQHGTDPVALASAMAHSVPKDVLVFLQRVGVDDLLDELPPEHPMASQLGRNYLRSVVDAIDLG